MTDLQTFCKVNFTTIALDDEYYQCTFESCDFSNSSMGDAVFEKCAFQGCNFALTKFLVSLREVKFLECKMTGADFTGIGKSSNTLVFEKSILNYAAFVGCKLRRSVFRESTIVESYFDESDIAHSVFEHCDLSRTSFHNTNLEKVDFSTAYNFTINPATNRLKKAIFSRDNLTGLVAHLDIVIN
jgi:uncharacterized protein YjbI with pentapeptide repeats